MPAKHSHSQTSFRFAAIAVLLAASPQLRVYKHQIWTLRRYFREQGISATLTHRQCSEWDVGDGFRRDELGWRLRRVIPRAKTHSQKSLGPI